MTPAPHRRPLRRWCYALWVLVALSLGLGVAVFVLTSDTHTAAGYTVRFLLARAHEDSWHPMVMAIDQLRREPEVPLYSKLFFQGGTKFIYPTSSLLALDGLQRATGASWPAVVATLNWLSWCGVWVTGLAAWRLFLDGDARTTSAVAPPSEQAHLLAAGLALTILFYPLTQSYVLGQIQTVVTGLATLTLLTWQRGWKRTAGLLMGICCAIKPQWAVVLLWGALRREWTMTAMAAASFGVLGLTSVALYGAHHWLDYLSVLSFVSQRGESYYPNQSVNGLVNRWLFNGSNVDWVPTGWPDFHPVVYTATLVAALLILSAALILRIRDKPGVLDLALIILSLTMASPVAWEHHYGVLLPIFAVLAPVCGSASPSRRYATVALLLAFLGASQRLDVTNRLADTRWNVLQSYLLVAAIIVLVLLYRSLQLQQASARAARGPLSGADAPESV